MTPQRPLSANKESYVCVYREMQRFGRKFFANVGREHFFILFYSILKTRLIKNYILYASFTCYNIFKCLPGIITARCIITVAIIIIISLVKFICRRNLISLHVTANCGINCTQVTSPHHAVLQVMLSIIIIIITITIICGVILRHVISVAGIKPRRLLLLHWLKRIFSYLRAPHLVRFVHGGVPLYAVLFIGSRQIIRRSYQVTHGRFNSIIQIRVIV